MNNNNISFDIAILVFYTLSLFYSFKIFINFCSTSIHSLLASILVLKQLIHNANCLSTWPIFSVNFFSRLFEYTLFVDFTK